MLTDFIALIFPNNCAACGNPLLKTEQCICLHCQYYLPKTNFHLQVENPVSKMFWGRVPVYSAAAYYNFIKGGNVQELIHQLKYKGRTQVGVTVGNWYGNELKTVDSYKTVDVIIPVPLHYKKIKKRGYNQSALFAKGLANGMNVHLVLDNLYRATATESQTRKSRYKRWQNVESVFKLKNIDALKGKHILLVDDVVTTGATLEACAQTLLQVPDVKISIVTMAFAAN